MNMCNRDELSTFFIMVHSGSWGRRGSAAFDTAAAWTQPLLRVCGLTLLLVLQCGTLLGQMTNATFVTRGDRGRDVLNVSTLLEIPPSMSFGVAQVTIATAAGPSKADRNLTLVFSTKSYGRSTGQHIAFRKSVQLAEGQSVVRVSIPHYQVSGQTSWDMQVFENGRDIEDRRKLAPNESDFQWSHQDGRTTTCGVLVGLTEPTLEVQANVTAINELYPVIPNQPNSLRLLSIQDASPDWRQYFPYSRWVLSAKTAMEINQQRPELRSALRSFVGAGGNLLIHSVGGESERAAVEAMFPNVGAKEAVWSTIKFPHAPWWNSRSEAVAGGLVADPNDPLLTSAAGQPMYNPPAIDVPSSNTLVFDSTGNLVVTQEATATAADKSKRDEAALSGLRVGGITYDAYLAAETWAKLKLGGHAENFFEFSELVELNKDLSLLGEYQLQSARDQLMTAVETESVMARKYLNGTVLVVSKPLDAVPAPLLLHAFEQTNSAAGQLLASEMDGDWFWRNLISAVGKPPVWMFCVMVALFGALLGPGLLLFTGRIKRRSLMILLVPCLSSLATLSIMVYSVLHEGFETHFRVTSVQFIDPSSGEGFAWSRQNFFSGLPPREGLTFSEHTYVRPVTIEGADSYGYPDPRGADCVVRLGEQQNWSGWLKARQQQQLLVGHPFVQASFPISVEQMTPQQIKVVNLTGLEIPLVAVRGGGADYYVGEAIAAGGSVLLDARDRVSGMSNVGRLMNDLRPTVPPELNSRGSLGGFGSRRSNLNIGNNQQADVINNVYTNYLSERAQFPNFGMVVVLNESDRIEVPLQGISGENVHVVIGVQPW